MQVLTEVGAFLPHGPAVVFPGVDPREVGACVHTESCTWTFMVALFIIGNPWEDQGVLQ